MGSRVDLYSPEILAVLAPAVEKHGLDLAVLRGIIAAESSGQAFGPDGRILIRFEPHVFAKLTARKKLGKRALSRDEIDKHGTIVLNPGMPNIHEPRKRQGGQGGEWHTLRRAMALDKDLALESTSMGLPQIMGFNFKAAGYPHAVGMFEAFKTGAAEQVAAMVRFITASPTLVESIRSKDFPRFVDIYNGADVGTPHNQNYVRRLVAAYEEARKRA